MFRRCATRSMLLSFALLATLSFAGPLSSARAAFTPIGDVEPSNPSIWTTSNACSIGNTASGTLTVNGGSDLLSSSGYLGYGSTATGVVNIAGTGSTWTDSYKLFVGVYGSGKLSITDGGSVTNSNNSFLGYFAGGTGVVTVNGVGSAWNNSNSLCVGFSGAGSVTQNRWHRPRRRQPRPR